MDFLLYFLVYIDFPCDYIFESLSCNMFFFLHSILARLYSLSDAVKIYRSFVEFLILCCSDIFVYGCSMQ